MKKFNGLAISSGKVFGNVCIFAAKKHNDYVTKKLPSEKHIPEELERFEKAIIHCSKELDTISQNIKKEIGKTEAEIFLVQKNIMNDPLIINDVKHEVNHNKYTIETALNIVFNK